MTTVESPQVTLPRQNLLDYSFNRGRRQERVGLLQAIQEEVNPEGFALEQHLALRDLLPDTFTINLGAKDMLPFAKTVKTHLLKTQTEGTKKQKTLKIARQWVGMALGSLAFWALPWPAVETATMPVQMLRSVSAMSPYFVLNLPDSAKQYKNILGITADSAKATVVLPYLLVKLGLWKITGLRNDHARRKEIMEEKAKDTQLSSRLVRREARQQVKDEVALATEKAEQRYIEATHPHHMQMLENVLPDWQKEDRIDILRREFKGQKTQAFKDGASIIAINFGLPLIFFKEALDFAAATGLSESLPRVTIAVCASFATLLFRRGIMRLYTATKKARKEYTRKKIGKEILLAIAQAQDA